MSKIKKLSNFVKENEAAIAAGAFMGLMILGGCIIGEAIGQKVGYNTGYRAGRISGLTPVFDLAHDLGFEPTFDENGNGYLAFATDAASKQNLIDEGFTQFADVTFAMK